MPRPKSNKESDRLRRMVHQHMGRRASLAPASAAAGAHLDEDALSVFVEGRLSEREAAPLIRHLVACASCRHITAQLIRLDTELSASEAPAPAPSAEEPGRIRRLLSDLAARVLPSSEEDVVFAYHAPADDFEKKDEAKGGEEAEHKEREE
jgi:Putative zinc-finger